MAVVVTAAFVTTLYWFFVTAGRGVAVPQQTLFYSLQADAFLNGQLHLPVEPSAELLANPKPLEAHAPPGLYDASLYKGRFYIYWGPVPALLLAAFKLATRIKSHVGDELLVVAFTVARLFAGAGLLLAMRKHLFPRLSPLLVAPALAVFGLGTPYLFTLGRPAVYEAAIEGGQLFMLLGLGAAFASVLADSRRRELALLSVAGLLWIAAAGCRITLAPTALALVAWSALVPTRSRRSGVLARLVAAGAPIALGTGLLLLYNFARFRSWSEFGLTYQLNPLRLSYSLSWWPLNLHAYFLRPVLVSCEFPFINAPTGAVALLPFGATPASGYLPLEPVVGAIVAAPVTLFGVFAAGSAIKTLSRTGWLQRALGADLLRVWVIGALSILVFVPLVPLLGLWTASMRYLADFASGLSLLAIVGFWTLASRLQAHGAWRRAAHATFALAAAYTLVFGVLLGFQGGYYGSFERLNPSLHKALRERLSCRP